MSRANTAKMSQDVFFERDLAGRIQVVDGDNAGTHFFRSLAELNRTKFVEQGASAGDRVALSMVHTIWNKGQGKIYIRDEVTHEFAEVTKIGEAQSVIFRALENMFNVEAHNSFQEMVAGIPNIGGSNEQQQAVSNEEESKIEQEDSAGTERRHSATTLEAASSLLLVQEAAAELDQDEDEDKPVEAKPQGQLKSEPEEEKSELQVKFESTNIAMINSFDSGSSSSSSSPPSSPETGRSKAAAAASGKPKKPERRRRSACATADFVADKPGIAFAKVASTDVLCGGSGEGVLAIRHEGNKRFLKVIEAQIEDFGKSDDKGKLRMSQQTAEHAIIPRGRFLAYNPETGLWHELKREKAWFKSLRTFLKWQSRHGNITSESSSKSESAKPRARPLPLHRPK